MSRDASTGAQWYPRLRAQVALGTGVLVAFSLGATFVVTSGLITNYAARGAAEHLSASATAFRHLVETRLRFASSRLALITVLPVFRAHLSSPALSQDGPTMSAMASEYRAQLDASFLVVTDPRGQWLAWTGLDEPEARTALVGSIDAATRGESPRALRLIDGHPTIVVSEPATFADEVLGTVTTGYILDDEVARELSSVTHSEVNLVAAGRLVASSVEPGPRTALAPHLVTLTPTPPSRLSVSQAGRQFDYTVAVSALATDTGVVPNAYLVLLDDWASTARVLADLRERVVWGGLFVFACALVGAAFLSGRVAGPLNDAAAAASEIAAGDWAREVPVRGSREAVTMATAFNAMRARLQHSYESLEDRNAALQGEIQVRQRTEAQLVVAKAAAEQASAAKSTFLANMSHELRTPLNAIIGYAELLLEETDATQEPARAADLTKIVGSGRHLVALVSEVLDFSKIEAGRMDVHLDDVDAQAIVQGVVEASAALAAARGNRLTCEGLETLGIIRTDEVKMRQVLLNLLGNAYKFTSDGLIAVRAWREWDAAAEWVAIEVRDTGIGMTQEQLGRLFQAFSQADESATRRYGGTGLGLAISQRLCQLLGGVITVGSRIGEGTSFVVRLPVDATGVVLSREGGEPHARAAA